nr:MAG TPA: hypothetical protein [Caudoviricetes sp.]
MTRNTVGTQNAVNNDEMGIGSGTGAFFIGWLLKS